MQTFKLAIKLGDSNRPAFQVSKNGRLELGSRLGADTGGSQWADLHVHALLCLVAATTIAAAKLPARQNAYTVGCK